MSRDKRFLAITVALVALYAAILIGFGAYLTATEIMPTIRYEWEKDAFFDSLYKYEKMETDQYVVDAELKTIEVYGVRESYRYVIPGVAVEDMYFYEFFSPMISWKEKDGFYLNPESEVKYPVIDLECFGIEIFDSEGDTVIEVYDSAISDIRKAIGGEYDGREHYESLGGGETLQIRVYLNEDRSFYWKGLVYRYKVRYVGSNEWVSYYAVSDIDRFASTAIENDGKLFAILDETFFSEK